MPTPDLPRSLLDTIPTAYRPAAAQSGLEQHVLDGVAASRPFRLLPIGRCGPRQIVMFEARIRENFPAYADRRRWIRWLGRELELPIAVFTDAAHSAYIWGWIERSEKSSRYREFLVPTRAQGLATAVELLGSPAHQRLRLRGRFHVEDRDEEIARALVERLRKSGLRCPDRPGSWVCWIERLVSPAPLRRLWRSLASTSFVDLDCGYGDVLLSCAAVLEPLYLAMLDRMRTWVDDPAAGEWRRRNRLADFAALVERSERREIHSSTVIFARRLIVQNNLFGVARSAAEARVCRDRLHRFASLRPAIAAVDSNVRSVPSFSGRIARVSLGVDAAAVTSAASFQVRVDDGPAEEVEALAHVLGAAREVRLDGGGDLEELREIGRELHRRQTRLVPRLDVEGGARVSDPSSDAAPDDSERECRLWALFPSLLGRPGPVLLPTGR